MAARKLKLALLSWPSLSLLATVSTPCTGLEEQEARLQALAVPTNVRVVRLPDGGIGLKMLMCRVDRHDYQQEPYRYPMFKDRAAHSECKTNSWIESIHISDEGYLEESTAPAKDGSDDMVVIPPSGFVFHMGRCGSTLVANMLASIPSHLVFSECGSIPSLMHGCEEVGCTSDELRASLQALMARLGRIEEGQASKMFLKFQSSIVNHMQAILDAFPMTPWIFVYRSPLEVMESFISKGSASVCAKVRDKSKRSLPVEQRCAEYLGSIMLSALDAFSASSGRGKLISYQNLSEAVPEIAMQHFGASLEGTDLQRMTATAEYYSKGRHASPRGHSDDAQLKQLKATPEMKKFSAEIADPVYAMLVSASQSQIGS